MFLPARMMKVTIIALEREKRALLTGLGRLGVTQLTSTTAPAGAAAKSGDVSDRLARCASALGRISELRRSLGIVAPLAPVFEASEAALEHDEQALGSIEERARRLLDTRKSLQERLRQLESESARLQDLSVLGVPLDRLQQSPYLHFVTGSVPDFQAAQERLAGQVLLVPLAKDNVIAIGTRRGRPDWEKRLQQSGFHSAGPLPDAAQSPEVLAATKRDEVEEVIDDIAHLDADLGVLTNEASQTVPHIEGRANLERLLLLAEQTLGSTASTVILTGWTLAVKAGLLEARVCEITSGRCFIDITAPVGVPEEDIPVLLHPSILMRPFHRLVAAYGLPSYHEIEPTLFLAVTYFVMFGMMFGDAGQGLVLMAAGTAAVVKGKKAGVRDVGALLMWAGLASILFGILYGSYFGIPQLKQHALWRDPLEGSPTWLLLGAVGFGAGTISLGLILNVVNRLRHRDFRSGFLGEFGLLGIGFYWGALALLAKAAVGQGGRPIGTASLVLLVLPIAGWIIKEVIALRASCEENSKRWGLAIPSALVGSFEAVLTYFANTVSFVRLAAYAMSHAALLVATFAVAHEVARISHVGSTLSIVIIVIGNVVAICLEGVIAAVQGLRLEFYEFFSKFFSAEGKPFDPFQLTGPPGSASGRTK